MNPRELTIITQDTLVARPDFEFISDDKPHQTIRKYGVHHWGERVGRIKLMERTNVPEVGFDVYISRSGQNLGITALQALAATLNEAGFDLVTAGIREHARPYWQHQADKALVVPVNPSTQTTNYKVLPR